MDKNILLVEPAYKSKYPPLGLMKISTYHRNIKNDKVKFVRGCNPSVRDEYWDRVYITTLFTYTWDETVKTINCYREILFSFARKIYVGGIIASLMPDDLFDATGIHPVEGLLDHPSKIDQNDEIIIDDLSPDYEILDQVNFDYAHKNAYLGYSTRGCPRRCKFCVVNEFEPKFIPYIDIKNLTKDVTENFGEKQNLLLMDNNVLCSDKFDEIIDDIIKCGFTKGASFGKTKRKRIVDFNQGLDARKLTEAKMKRLKEIPLEPMRLAFDNIKMKKSYVKAVRLAHKHGQKNMSNYILYNYKDTPEDFYERLKININLNEEFKNNSSSNAAKTTIYSFPMRYIPIRAKKRNVDTGNKNWNKRYLRGIQVILSVIKGPVMTGKQFFEQAFGRNAEELIDIILMPDEFIRNRLKPNWYKIKSYEGRLAPYVKKWMDTIRKMTEQEKINLIRILSENNLDIIGKNHENTNNKKIKLLLNFHLSAKEMVAGYRNGKS